MNTQLFFASSMVVLSACGGGVCKTATSDSPTAVTGTVYQDSDGDDQSLYQAGYEADIDEPLAERLVRFLTPSGWQETFTCDDGTFAIEEAGSEPGFLFSGPEDGESCQQQNCAQRLPTALDEGEVTILTFGDSIPVIGDAPMFPSRLATLLEGVASVDNRNEAVGGTISSDWLPGSSLFNSRVVPNIQDADVIIISVGGNDITQSIDAEAMSDPTGAVDAAYDLVDEIAANIRDMIVEIRSQNPDVDIVYCLYVDYSLATIFPWGLADSFLPEGTISGLLAHARDIVPTEQGILLADLYGASQVIEAPLDDYLYDQLHFNDRGQTLYAEEIFKIFGGVVAGDSPLEGQARSPLGLTQSFSFSNGSQ